MSLRSANALIVMMLAGVAGVVASGGRASASEILYEYHVEHPRYGNIGTYSNLVSRSGDDSVVRSELHIAVRLLGIVVFREEGARTERWHGNRLVGFDSWTETNGDRIEVHGEARGDGFVLTTPRGVVTAPADVHPSNPWAEWVLDSAVLMSTKTGQVEHVSVTGGGETNVTFDGKTYHLRQFEIDSNKRQFVWLDDRGTPIAFRTEQEGAPIDFVLNGMPQVLAENTPR